MSTSFPSPGQSAPVTAEQRDRAEHWLQNAYAEGRLPLLHKYLEWKKQRQGVAFAKAIYHYSYHTP